MMTLRRTGQTAAKMGLAGLVGVVLLLVILGQGTVHPVQACCYDPPDDDSMSDTDSAPPADDAGEAGDTEEAMAPAPAASANQSVVTGAPTEGDGAFVSSAPSFAMVRQMMAEGRYLRARQIAESRLKTRPYDHNLWALLEQIYEKLGLQGRTADAAYQAKISDPDGQPPAPPPPAVSAQKRYVTKLLQAVREFKPID